MTETTYILTHGAWSGAWSWREVGAELTMRGVPWSALDLPSPRHTSELGCQLVNLRQAGSSDGMAAGLQAAARVDGNLPADLRGAALGE